MTTENYLGYAYLEEDGMHLHPVYLRGEEVAMGWLFKWGVAFPEVRLCDGGDYCVAHVIGGKLVFPKLAEGTPTDVSKQRLTPPLTEGEVEMTRQRVVQVNNKRSSASAQNAALLALEDMIGVARS